MVKFLILLKKISMKNLIKISSVLLAFAFIGFTNSKSDAEALNFFDDEAGIECRCNNNQECVASGQGATCWEGSRCWKADRNCRGSNEQEVED